MSHLIGRTWVWKKDGKTFFTCPDCRGEHKMSAKTLVSDKNSASGKSIKLESEDGRWVTIPLSDVVKAAPWLLKDIVTSN